MEVVNIPLYGPRTSGQQVCIGVREGMKHERMNERGGGESPAGTTFLCVLSSILSLFLLSLFHPVPVKLKWRVSDLKLDVQITKMLHMRK